MQFIGQQNGCYSWVIVKSLGITLAASSNTWTDAYLFWPVVVPDIKAKRPQRRAPGSICLRLVYFFVDIMITASVFVFAYFLKSGSSFDLMMLIDSIFEVDIDMNSSDEVTFPSMT